MAPTDHILQGLLSPADVVIVYPSHVLTLCTVASLLLVGQYARLLLANEVTNEVPVSPQTCSLHERPSLTDLGQTKM